MLRHELKLAYENGWKVWIYMGAKYINGMVTAMDKDHVQLTKISEGTSVLRDRFIIRIDRIDYISVNDTEEWNRERLNCLLQQSEI